jgi:hypothetical protein
MEDVDETDPGSKMESRGKSIADGSESDAARPRARGKVASSTATGDGIKRRGLADVARSSTSERRLNTQRAVGRVISSA